MQIRNLTLAIVTVAVLASAMAGCAGQKRPAVPASSDIEVQQLIISAQDSARTSASSSSHGGAKAAALEGIVSSERCILAAPDNAGCYYWRAVNTGLFLRVNIIGYQRGVKKMIEDCKKVIAFDPSYEHAGAFLILGQLYTQLPQTGGTADSVVRNLPFAEENLKKATEIAPDYPENYLSLAETLYEEEKKSEAAEALAKGKELSSNWRGDRSYNEWVGMIRKLEKKIRKMKK